MISRAAIALLGILFPLAAVGGDFAFFIGERHAEGGGKFSVPILAEAPVEYQGFSVSVRFPPKALEVERISVQGTILEAIFADFVASSIYQDDGLLTLGVLADAVPPFDRTRIPPAGYPLEMAYIEGTATAAPPATAELEFATEVDPPAVPNLFSVDNYPVVPSVLTPGRVIIEVAQREPGYIRADVNLDARIDIADPIMLLEIRFIGDVDPRCEAAADANADDAVDVSDAVFTLSFLFLGGPRPFPPQGSPGPNPFRSSALTCVNPLEWLPAR